MNWLGKFVGALIGLLLLAPFGLGLIGAIVGAVIGHSVDENHNFANRTRTYAVSQIFLDISFAVMGHIAKSDGYVSEDEIRAARQIMVKIGLNDNQRQRAIEQFTRGKQPTFDLDSELQKLVQICQQQRQLLQMFIEVQLQAAYANGLINPNQRRILQHICHRLGIRGLNFDLLHVLYGRFSSGFQYQQSSNEIPSGYTTPDALEEAYATLGIKHSASDAEVKRAYRKLMSQHHPDKLISKGLPPEMMKIATEKAQKIQKAYESICKARHSG